MAQGGLWGVKQPSFYLGAVLAEDREGIDPREIRDSKQAIENRRIG